MIAKEYGISFEGQKCSKIARGDGFVVVNTLKATDLFALNG